MHRTHLFGVFVPLLFLGATALFAQTKADEELIARARSLYFTPASRPAYIACDSTPDWDAIVKALHRPQTDQLRRELELTNAMKVSFVTRGLSNTKVMTVGDATVGSQKAMIRNQIIAFFRVYWTVSDGRLLPVADMPYEVTSTPEGYVVTQESKAGSIQTVQMDSSLVVTKAHSVQGMGTVDMTPVFKKENDGLLHLTSVLLDENVGMSRLLVEYNLDYQQAGGFYVPQEVTTSVPGALSYNQSFTHCQALNKSNTPPPPPKTESTDPQ